MTTIEDRIELISGFFWGRDPQEELAWLRANAPVWRDPQSGVWGVATYDLVKYVSTHPELFSNTGGIRPEYGPTPMMIDMDDPDHWQRRRLVNKGFTPKRVRDKEAMIRSIVDTLIDNVCEQGECDLVTDIAAWLPLIVIADALGVDPADHADLLRWSDDMLSFLGQGNDQLMVRAMDAAAAYNKYAQSVIESRRREPKDDLMNILVHAEVDGKRLDDAEILQESMLILNGGDETTRHVISGGVYQLLRDRDQWNALQQNRELLPTAVEEMLRWVTPIKNMARLATTDVELGGQMISAGEKVILLYPSANRDEAVFEDASRFDIARSPNEHVAFGFGAHFCLGANLARVELRVVLEKLLDRLPDLSLAGPGAPENRASNFVSGYESLPVRFTPTVPVGNG